MGPVGSSASILLITLCCVLGGFIAVSVVILRPFWRPLPPPEKERRSRGSWRRRVLALRYDDSDYNDQEPLARSEEDFPDLGKRYLDFIAQALAQGRIAASNGGPRSPHRDPPSDDCRRGPCCTCGGSGGGGGGFPPSFPDASLYDEVVLSTDWDAEGFLAACMFFAIFTAEYRRARATAGGNGKPYPLRTVIVEEGGEGEVDSSRSSNKASRVRETLAAMRGTGVVPRDCCVDVFEGAAESWGGEASPLAVRGRRAQRVGEGDGEENEGPFLGSFFGAFTALLQSAGMALLGRGWLWRRKGGAYLARKKLREVLAVARQERRRVLVIVLKRPPRELTQVLLGKDEAEWWRLGRSYDRERVDKREGRDVFDHVDVLVSGVSTSRPRGVFSGAGKRGGPWRPRSNTGDSGYDRKCIELMSGGDVLAALNKVKKVFVVQLHDQVGSYGFPRAISLDRTPILAAAVAGARGSLPSALRRMIATSNDRALVGFPDNVAAAISRGRYANEDLRSKAAAIAAAAAAVAAEAAAASTAAGNATETHAGRARLAELGSRMADLIATDFEAVDAAGLSPGTHQAIFRSLDVRVSLSGAAAAWALACPDAVCWENFPSIGGVDACSGRLMPLDVRGSCQGKDVHLRNNPDVTVGDYDDYQYGAECSSHGKRDFRGVSTKRGSGTAPVGSANRSYTHKNNISTLRRARGYTSDSGFCIGNGGLTEAGKAEAEAEAVAVAEAVGEDRASFANGFARGFERLDDQEEGYAEFAGFLVHLLDQMP